MGIEDPNLMGPLLSFREIILVEAPETLPSTQLPLIQEAKDKFTIFRGWRACGLAVSGRRTMGGTELRLEIQNWQMMLENYLEKTK